MNKTSRFHPGILISLPAVLSALILSLVNGYFYLFHIDVTDVDGIYKTILIKNDGSKPILILLFVLILAALTVFCLIFMKKRPPVCTEKESLALIFARCVMGAVLVATLIMRFVLSPVGTPYVMEWILSQDGMYLPASTEHYVVLASLVLTLPAALYFLLPGLFSVKNKTVLFVTGLCALLFMTCELLLTHYFMIEFLSSPTRVFAIFGYSSLILFLLFDLKTIAHEQRGGKLRVLFALLAFVLNTADALPRLVLSFMAKDPFSVTLVTFHTLLRLALGIYALISILPLFQESNTADQPSPPSSNPEEELTEKPIEEQTEVPLEVPTKEQTEEAPDAGEDAPATPDVNADQTPPPFEATQTIEENQGDLEENG